MGSDTYSPLNVAHPGETVTNYLEAFEWSQRDLSRRTGITTKTISEICNGKSSISPSTALAFEKVFGRPAHFWINLQSRFDEFVARGQEKSTLDQGVDWVKNFPLNEMRKRGWLSEHSDSNESDLKDVLHFFGVSSPKSWLNVWDASKVAYRQTLRFSVNEFAMASWVRAVELQADQLEVRDFDERRLLDSLEKIRACTRKSIDEALYETQEILAGCGVAFVCVPSLKNTGISGCTKWISPKKVVVALSLRYKFDDQIWFTSFHELGHVLKHRKQRSFILDNAEGSLLDGSVDPEMQKLEDEANRFAADTLIEPELLGKFISFEIFTNDSIYEFSEAINVSPGIVVGRLQREGLLEPHEGNKLKQRVNWRIN